MEHFKNSPKELKEYAAKIADKHALDISGFEFAFSDTLPPLYLGDCRFVRSRTGLRPVIRISTFYWSLLSDSAKERLIEHELGHCADGLPHSPGIMGAETPLRCE